jgi:hypothetical protein
MTASRLAIPRTREGARRGAAIVPVLQFSWFSAGSSAAGVMDLHHLLLAGFAGALHTPPNTAAG